MDIRAIVQQFARTTGVSAWAGRRVHCGRIVMFHGIEPAHAELFEQQLRYVAAHYEVVPLATLLQRAGGPLRHEVALTFDDGLRNNFSVVYPILRRLALPATFFVCPRLIDGENWLWNHEARARLQSLESKKRTGLGGEIGAPAGETETIVEWMKGLPAAERRRVEQAIRAATPRFEKTPEQRVRFDPMSWSELTSLDRNLVSIGSHTLSHPILSTLDDAELEAELSGSRAQLESHLGTEVPHFCYPNGSHNASVVAGVRRHYSAAVTTDAAFVQNGPDPHLLPRIPWGPSVALLAWRLWRPTA